jgi:hypothetical protein
MKMVIAEPLTPLAGSLGRRLFGEMERTDNSHENTKMTKSNCLFPLLPVEMGIYFDTIPLFCSLHVAFVPQSN